MNVNAPAQRRAELDLESMQAGEAAEMFSALSQRWRLEAFRLLARYLPQGLAAGDVARLLAVPHNTMSTHLAILERAGLIESRREGRSIIYSAVQQQTERLADFLAGCRPNKGNEPDRRGSPADDRAYNVLILCSQNSARSILAEAILNREGRGMFRAYSAGTHPKHQPDPECLTLLEGLGYEMQNLRSKSWREFSAPDAPRMDLVLTVCDAAAREKLSPWPGEPIVAHWGIEDPDCEAGVEAARREAFVEAYRLIASRVSELVNLDLIHSNRSHLARSLAEIGAMEGATKMALERCTSTRTKMAAAKVNRHSNRRRPARASS